MLNSPPEHVLVGVLEERASHARRLAAFHRWLIPIATFFGLVEVVAFFPTGNVQVGLTGLIILAYTAAIIVARSALKRNGLETAVRITAVGIVVAAVSIGIVQPELWTPLSGIPFVAVGVALPTARGRDLPRLLVGAGASVGLIAALGALNLAPSHLPAWFLNVFNAGAVVAVATLVLVLLYQFSDRLTTALSDSITANRALVTTQAELESERERLDTTLRSIGDGVVATDRDGHVVFLNPVAERLTGWTPAAAIGQRNTTILDIRTDAGPAGGRDPGGPVLVARDGQHRPIAHATAPILAHDGTVHGAVVVFRDVSEERQLAQQRLAFDRQILESQKLESLATLAGGVAQQFNNLLVVIIGNATMARDELANEAPDGLVLTALRDIETAADRAAVLAQQMLAFGGHGRFILSEIDLGAAVREIVELLETTLPATVTVRFELAASIPAIHADATQIRQLLTALIVNAVEAIGDEPGTITIATRVTTIDRVGGRTVGSSDGATANSERSGPRLQPVDGPIGARGDSLVVALSVQDTGGGMDEDTRRQAFLPFFTTKFVGRGLGLAAALGIARGHLGRIDVASEPGEGSTFTVLFPAHEGLLRAGPHGAEEIQATRGRPVER